MINITEDPLVFSTVEMYTGANHTQHSSKQTWARSEEDLRRLSGLPSIRGAECSQEAGNRADTDQGKETGPLVTDSAVPGPRNTELGGSPGPEGRAP